MQTRLFQSRKEFYEFYNDRKVGLNVRTQNIMLSDIIRWANDGEPMTEDEFVAVVDEDEFNALSLLVECWLKGCLSALTAMSGLEVNSLPPYAN